ncbi:MAG: hypothetical protein GYA15_09990 [Leptolinea sp.]|nr:hypothetical protein [Leptolinea sp.]
MIKNFFSFILPIVVMLGMTGCERPSTIAPVSVAPTTAPAVKAVTPTLMIKTPVKVATQASGFQEILSATQTAVATIRSGTLTATAMSLTASGITTGTPGEIGTPGTPGTPGITSTPMALGTIYPATPEGSGTPAVTTGTPGTQTAYLSGTMAVPTATKFVPNFPVIPGVPTFGILSVVGDSTVTIMTSEFPAKSKYTVYMGAYGTRGLGGTLLGTFDTDAGGQKTLVFNIPATLKGFSPIDMRIEFPDGRYALNFFYNFTASSN